MDLVTFNIGGTLFTTRQSTFQAVPGTRLSKLHTSVEEYDSNSNRYFFDRNPRVFESILDFYRTGELHFPGYVCGAVLRRELEFWEIPLESVSDCCFATVCDYDDSKMNMLKLKKAFENQELQFSDSQLQNNKINHLRDKIWRFMNFPKSSKPALIYSSLYTLWLVLPILTSVLSTHPRCRETRNVRYQTNASGNDTWVTLHQYLLTTTANQKLALMRSSGMAQGLLYTEAVCMMLFGLEVILRVVCCPDVKKLMKCPLNYIDCIVLTTSLIAFGIELNDGYQNEGLFWFYMLCRSLVILRIFRLIHLTRHIGGLRVLILATGASVKELFLLLVSFLSVAVFFAAVVYYAEFNHPDSFPDMPITLWWSVVTMTTVGYGDFTPSTITGYTIGSVCALSGVLIISMPIAVIASNFAEFDYRNKIRLQKEKLAEAKPKSSNPDRSFVKKTKTAWVTDTATHQTTTQT